MITRIQLRRDTTANWGSVDPVLAAGEAGYDLDTKKLKIGDGATKWSSLPVVNADNGGGGTPITAGIGPEYVCMTITDNGGKRSLGFGYKNPRRLRVGICLA